MILFKDDFQLFWNLHTILKITNFFKLMPKNLNLFRIRMIPVASNPFLAFLTKNELAISLLGLILFYGRLDERLRSLLLSRPGTWEIPTATLEIPEDIRRLIKKLKRLIKEGNIKELIEWLKKLLEEALGKGLAHELYFILFFLIYVLYVLLITAYNVEFLRNYVFVLYWCLSFLEGFYGGTFFKNRKAAIRKRPLLVDRTSTNLHMWLRRKFPKLNHLILKLEAKWFFFKNRKILKKLQNSPLQFPFPFMTE